MKQCDSVELIDIGERLEELASVYWNSSREWPMFTRNPQPTAQELGMLTGPFGASTEKWKKIESELEEFKDDIPLGSSGPAALVDNVLDKIKKAKSTRVASALWWFCKFASCIVLHSISVAKNTCCYCYY